MYLIYTCFVYLFILVFICSSVPLQPGYWLLPQKQHRTFSTTLPFLIIILSALFSQVAFLQASLSQSTHLHFDLTSLFLFPSILVSPFLLLTFALLQLVLHPYPLCSRICLVYDEVHIFRDCGSHLHCLLSPPFEVSLFLMQSQCPGVRVRMDWKGQRSSLHTSRSSEHTNRSTRESTGVSLVIYYMGLIYTQI